MTIEREADLYPYIKAHLESVGYQVKGEVCKCDAVGYNGQTVVAVEMKLTFGLPVIYQAISRLTSCDLVYVAVAVPEGRKARANWDEQVPHAVQMCRMLGVGLLSVRDGLVVVDCDPAPYVPRKQPKRRAKLLSEFTRRTGDWNVGGTTKRPRVTAYREEALLVACKLSDSGAMSPARLREETGLPDVGKFLQGNVYNWFERVERGVYNVTQEGKAALVLYADVVAARSARVGMGV